MNVLTWHVHGSWTTAFVQGQHTYLIPVLPDRGPDGRGRAETHAWPEAVMELPPETLSSMDVDVVVLQRPHEWQLAESWLGRRLGRDVLRAAETAPGYGAQVWSITGRHRDPLSSRSTQFLTVDSDDGQIVQDVHQVAIHLLCACLDGALRTPGRHRPGSRP
jgi:hypothetical protein